MMQVEGRESGAAKRSSPAAGCDLTVHQGSQAFGDSPYPSSFGSTVFFRIPQSRGEE